MRGGAADRRLPPRYCACPISWFCSRSRRTTIPSSPSVIVRWLPRRGCRTIDRLGMPKANCFRRHAGFLTRRRKRLACKGRRRHASKRAAAHHQRAIVMLAALQRPLPFQGAQCFADKMGMGQSQRARSPRDRIHHGWYQKCRWRSRRQPLSGRSLKSTSDVAVASLGSQRDNHVGIGPVAMRS